MSNEHTEHDIKAKKDIEENIEKFGCFIALFESDNYLPGFAYTIGLYEKFNHPEIICFGLNVNLMRELLNQALDVIKSGEIIKQNKLYNDFLEDYTIQFIEVDKNFYPNYMGYAGWYYGSSDFPVLQIVWPDKQHKFPWADDFNPDWKFKQPLLDRNTDFKFYEERNLGVFTTKHVLDGEPILFVYHNENGDWQFHSSSEPDINDSKLVCLEEITKLDPTINEIYHLQYGYRAWRETVNDDWEYTENEEEE